MALATLLASCSSLPPPAEDLRLPGTPPQYSLVFIVHGDGDYSYHAENGDAHRADREIVAEARRIAECNPTAEVSIFHEIPRRHVLFLFPRRDGRAYYYRHGRLVAQESYWRDEGPSRFSPEARLHGQFAAPPSGGQVRILLYFGHELPEAARAGYDASDSKRLVTIQDLAEGAGQLAGDSAKIDLLVLATCFGGTPRTIGALAPYARTIVASPENLHLSSFDLAPLASLAIGAGPDSVAAFADRFAGHAFERLASTVQTTVSVVVYDTDGAADYLAAAAAPYERALAVANDLPPASIEHCDCADDATMTRSGMSDGLTVRYRAPRFGRLKLKPEHSGWGCWRIPPGAALETATPAPGPAPRD